VPALDFQPWRIPIAVARSLNDGFVPPRLLDNPSGLFEVCAMICRRTKLSTVKKAPFPGLSVVARRI
jgi:hypothetical protein